MMTALLVSTIVSWILLLLLSLAVLALYRHFGQLYINSPAGKVEQGPELGSHLLTISDNDQNGRPITLPTPGPVAVIFTDTECTLCATVRVELRAFADAPDAFAVVFCSGRSQDVDAWSQGLPENVAVVHDRRSMYANKYEVNGTPFAIVAGSEGLVHSKAIVNGADGVRWIMTELRHTDVEMIDLTNRTEYDR